LTLSPPLIVCHWPLPHSGHGGSEVVDCMSISFPQLAHR
jgi:hypothetical protein